jgi:hypothetical protein
MQQQRNRKADVRCVKQDARDAAELRKEVPASMKLKSESAQETAVSWLSDETAEQPNRRSDD